MGKTNFWNDAAKYGAAVGLLLAVSTVVENSIVLSGRLGLYVLLTVEWIAAVVLHYYLLHRYTRQRAMQRAEAEGFSFGEAYGFIVAMSAFGGIISGAVQYIYVYDIIGYGRYVERTADALYAVMARNGNVSPSMENLLSQTVAQMHQSPEPSVFSAVGGGMLTSVLFGLVFGLCKCDGETRFVYCRSALQRSGIAARAGGVD